jgi:hypothetical protein
LLTSQIAKAGSPLALARQAVAFGNLPFGLLRAGTVIFYLVIDKLQNINTAAIPAAANTTPANINPDFGI